MTARKVPGTPTIGLEIGKPRHSLASSLLSNDTDVDGDTLTVTSVGAASGGTVSLSGTTITFSPDAGYSGPASFQYTVSDGQGGTDIGTVNLTVDGNLPPVAQDDLFTTTENAIVNGDIFADNGNGVEDERGVFHRLGKRADLVEGRGEGDEAEA